LEVIEMKTKLQTPPVALAAVTAIGLFVVNTMGFIDTVTGSALGCGKDWPLCNGELIPILWNRAVGIEYFHRVVALLVMLGLAVFTCVAWKHGKRRKEIRILLVISVISVLTEAALGALSVLLVNPPAILAFHMGIALTSFTSNALLWAVFYRIRKNRGRSDVHTSLPWQRPLRKIGKLSAFTLVYTLLAIYYGAYVTRSGTGAAFTGWPLPLEPPGPVFLIDMVHRLVAAGLLIVVWKLVGEIRIVWNWHKDLKISGIAALVLLLSQIMSGFLLISSHLKVWTFLLHVSIVSLFFCSISYIVLKTLPYYVAGRFRKNQGTFPELAQCRKGYSKSARK
jgi:cytochrome c oxidase assembly protein subunit 15